MAFWCVFFTRVLIFDYGMFRLVSFVMECFMYDSSHPSYDGNERVDSPSVTLYDVD